MDVVEGATVVTAEHPVASSTWLRVRVVPTGEAGYVFGEFVEFEVAALPPTAQPRSGIEVRETPGDPPARSASPTGTPEVAPTPAAALSSRATSGTGLSAEDERTVEAVYASMTTRQRVGQMLMYGFAGNTASNAASLVSRYQPGGIVLWQRLAGPSDAAALTNGLQRLAREAGLPPMFIAIDQEGGEIERLRDGIAYFPSKLILGATHRADLALLEGQIEGQELRALGLNMNLGPVLDVETESDNPIIARYQRSLGSDPLQVGAMGAAYIDGLQAQRVVAVAKHFPGHGGTREDSHASLPTVNHDRDTLAQVDLPPFRAASRDVGAMMAAHLLLPAIDARWPTSMSPTFLTGILRDEIGYRGVVMTDDMGAMAAIASNYSAGRAAVQAVRAGADMIMLVGPTDRQEEAFNALLAAFESGDLPREQLEASVHRILRLKAQSSLLSPPATSTSLAEVGSPAHLAAVRQIAEAAVTLVQGASWPVPEPSALRQVLVISPGSLPKGQGGLTWLGRAVQDRGVSVTELMYNPTGNNGAVLTRALSLAPEADLIVVATADASSWQLELVRTLVSQHIVPVVIGIDSPYEIARLPRGITYIAAYAARQDMIEAAVRGMFGEIPMRGALPVHVSDAYPAGYSYQPASVSGSRRETPGPTPPLPNHAMGAGG